MILRVRPPAAGGWRDGGATPPAGSAWERSDFPVPAPTTLDAFLDSAPGRWADESTTELLYIKRAMNPRDPWSGNVGFPGGRRDPEDVDDLATAIREVKEEVGLDLQRGPFVFMGRLSDRPVYARGRRAGMVLCPYVFVQTAKETPPLVMQPGEIASARWVSLSHLAEENVDTHAIQQPFGMIPAIAALPAWVKRVLGVDIVHYPAILLPYTSSSGAVFGPGRQPSPPRDVGGVGGATAFQTAFASDVASVLATTRKPAVSGEAGSDGGSPTIASASVGEEGRPRSSSHELQFQLWGLTLQATSDLLTLIGMRRLNWPPIRFGSWGMNTLVYAACGGLEMAEAARSQRDWSEVSGRHVVALVAWSSVAMATAAVSAWVVVAGLRVLFGGA